MFGLKMTCVACIAPARATNSEPRQGTHVVLGTVMCEAHAAAAHRHLEAGLRRLSDYCPCGGECHRATNPCSMTCAGHHHDVAAWLDTVTP